jgi:carboxypeptidase C (cathepsin A)
VFKLTKEPVGVGYSYSDDGGVNNSPAAAEDVYAFLALFVSQFKDYSKQDFHIAGESYAGTYLPNIAAVGVSPPSIGHALCPLLVTSEYQSSA